MTDDEINEAIGGKLCDVLGENGEMVTKWLVVAEIVDENGERWARYHYHDGATRWDNLGLLRYAEQQEQASAIVNF